jgi:hypothetical protein
LCVTEPSKLVVDWETDCSCPDSSQSEDSNDEYNVSEYPDSSQSQSESQTLTELLADVVIVIVIALVVVE